MHYHISISPDFWPLRYPEWHTFTVKEQRHRYQEFAERVNSWLSGEQGASMLTVGDLVKITEIDPAGLFTITPLFDPHAIIHDFIALVSDNNLMAHHIHGPYQVQKDADLAVDKAKAALIERANAYLNTKPVVMPATEQNAPPHQLTTLAR